MQRICVYHVICLFYHLCHTSHSPILYFYCRQQTRNATRFLMSCIGVLCRSIVYTFMRPSPPSDDGDIADDDDITTHHGKKHILSLSWKQNHTYRCEQSLHGSRLNSLKHNINTMDTYIGNQVVLDYNRIWNVAFWPLAISY